MRRSIALNQISSLSELSSYYRQCLALERQSESVFSDNVLFEQPRFPPRFFPVASFADSWDNLLATKAAKDAADLAMRGERRAVIFTPLMFAFREGDERRWEPVTGVFCQLVGKTLKVDPTDIFVGRIIRGERSFEEVSEIKAKLEGAARQSPHKFIQTSVDVLSNQKVEEVPLDKLRQIAPPKVVKCWGFLVVGESPYDRALLEELDKLAQLGAGKISHSALNFLFAPPEVEEPTLSDILLALANPVSPTISQAVALAHAMKAPLTVITGPPGTGKTRIIVGLIIHHLLTGQSVLLSSKINRAVDAAVELAERLMGKGCILRTGNQQEIERLQERVDELLERREWRKEGELFSGMKQNFAPNLNSKTVATNLIQSVKAEVNQLAEEINERCKRLNRMGKRLSRFGLRPVCPHHHGKRGLKRFFCKKCWKRWQWEFGWRIRLGERRWIEFNDEWKKLERKFESLREEIIPTLRSKLAHALWLKLNELLLRGKKDLEKLGSALSDPSNSGRKERIAAFNRIAQLGFPIAVTNLSIGNNLPFETCFDTLIVDEASSCDPASLLPLLYRAKRVVIVGDPKQLDHVTQGRWKQVEAVPKLRSVDGEILEASFDVSAYSLFERLIGGEKRTFWLTDHFRCPPSIIAFANKQFYGGRLRIHTQNYEPEPITHEKVSGNHRRNADGSATNEEQIRKALQLLVEWARKYPKNTIGLVAPYRAFIDDVLDILYSNPNFEILREKHERQELIVGTAHRFQGSEVDYLVFATVVGDNGGRRESGWIENPNLFNVAITRARRKLTILISPVFEKHLFLTRRLLKAKPVSSDESNVDERKGFIKEVATELERLGIAFRAGAVYHGDPIDLIEDSDEPEWGVLLVSWDDVATWKPLDFLRFLERQVILKQRKLLLWRIFPPEFENLVAELLMVSERRWG